MKPKNLFKAGYISRTHGLKGEVTANLEKVVLPGEVIKVFLESDGQFTEFEAEHFSARPDKAFIKLSGIDTIEQAQALRGSTLFLIIPERKSSAATEFYDEEISGFHIDDLELGRVGRVEKILNLPGNRLIECNRDGKTFLIPVNGPFIQKIDRRKKTISVNLPDGFMEL
ncbi:MAG: ribosome maturation factor RimM [Cyclobacteriaceae bacterium]